MLLRLLGGAYTSVYWCVYPPDAEVTEQVVPRLEECHDQLQERLTGLQQRQTELRSELSSLRGTRQTAKLRRTFMEYKSVSQDAKVTETTLWTVERQLQLLSRTELDSVVIQTLKSSNSLLQDVSKYGDMASTVEELTETLQTRMQEINEMNEAVATSIERTGGSDLGELEQELEDFFASGECDEVVTEPRKTSANLASIPAANSMENTKNTEENMVEVELSNMSTKQQLSPVDEATASQEAETEALTTAPMLV